MSAKLGFVDSILERVLGSGEVAIQYSIQESEIDRLCRLARAEFLKQPPLLELEPPVRVVGDTHGQYADLIRLLNVGGFPPETNYLFLGDYVDRGKQSLETIVLLLAYRIKYPSKFLLLRGNHECQAINRVYGFYDECVRKYSVKLWNAFQEAFNCMPFAGLIGGRILCMHGGLSPHIKSLDDLRHIKRPVDPPQPSMLMDLLWADPDRWSSSYQNNTRGVSVVFGADVVQRFCRDFDLDLIARAHQVVQDGYEFFADRRLVTIFSAPHYCGEFDNSAAVMCVDEQLVGGKIIVMTLFSIASSTFHVCSFNVLRPTVKAQRVQPA